MAESEVSPEAKTQGKRLWLRVLDFLEHPLFLWAAGIVAGVVAYFIYPVLAVCGICVLLAFHRAKVVIGLRLRWQIASYAVLFIFTTLVLLKIGILIKTHVPQLATVSDIREFARQSTAAPILPTQRSHPSPSSKVGVQARLQPRARTEIPPTTIIQTAPTFGNIKERAVELSKDIMDDLCLHGWNPGAGAPPCQVPVMVKMPTQIDERIAWGQTRCWYFRNNFQDRVVKIHNEFADLHLEDNELNEFVGNTKYKDSPFTPVEIQLVAERLLVLASKVEK